MDAFWNPFWSGFVSVVWCFLSFVGLLMWMPLMHGADVDHLDFLCWQRKWCRGVGWSPNRYIAYV
jgi:hypothetical protein